MSKDHCSRISGEREVLRPCHASARTPQQAWSGGLSLLALGAGRSPPCYVAWMIRPLQNGSASVPGVLGDGDGEEVLVVAEVRDEATIGAHLAETLCLLTLRASAALSNGSEE